MQNVVSKSIMIGWFQTRNIKKYIPGPRKSHIQWGSLQKVQVRNPLFIPNHQPPHFFRQNVQNRYPAQHVMNQRAQSLQPGML
jgi:hypothetical protein